MPMLFSRHIWIKIQRPTWQEDRLRNIDPIPLNKVNDIPLAILTLPLAEGKPEVR
jgi:hypothetical protein